MKVYILYGEWYNDDGGEMLGIFTDYEAMVEWVRFAREDFNEEGPIETLGYDELGYRHEELNTGLEIMAYQYTTLVERNED